MTCNRRSAETYLWALVGINGQYVWLIVLNSMNQRLIHCDITPSGTIK